jgi:hypothetical protein
MVRERIEDDTHNFNRKCLHFLVRVFLVVVSIGQLRVGFLNGQSLKIRKVHIRRVHIKPRPDKKMGGRCSASQESQDIVGNTYRFKDEMVWLWQADGITYLHHSPITNRDEAIRDDDITIKVESPVEKIVSIDVGVSYRIPCVLNAKENYDREVIVTVHQYDLEYIFILVKMANGDIVLKPNTDIIYQI